MESRQSERRTRTKYHGRGSKPYRHTHKKTIKPKCKTEPTEIILNAQRTEHKNKHVKLNLK